jgi:hypothetical protein
VKLDPPREGNNVDAPRIHESKDLAFILSVGQVFSTFIESWDQERLESRPSMCYAMLMGQILPFLSLIT